MRAESAELLARFSRAIPDRLRPNRGTPPPKASSTVFREVIISTPDLNLPRRVLRGVPPLEQDFRERRTIETFNTQIFRAKSAPIRPDQFPLKCPNVRLTRDGILAREAQIRKNFKRRANERAIQTDFAAAIDIICLSNQPFAGQLVNEAQDPSSAQPQFRYNADSFKKDEESIKAEVTPGDGDFGSFQRFMSTVRHSSDARKAHFFRKCNENADANLRKFVNFAGNVSAFGAQNCQIGEKALSCDGKAGEAQEAGASDETHKLTGDVYSEINHKVLQREFMAEKPQIRQLVFSIAEKEAQILFAKFISTDRRSRQRAADELEVHFQQYYDIVQHNDFGPIQCARQHTFISEAHQYLALNSQIMANLQRYMFWGVIEKQLTFCAGTQPDLLSGYWTCSLEHLCRRLKLSAAVQEAFGSFAYKHLFQIFGSILLSRQFSSIEQLSDSSPAFFSVAALSVLNESLFAQSEAENADNGRFSSQLLDYLIVYCMRCLNSSYEAHTLSAAGKTSNSTCQILDDDLLHCANIDERQTADCSAFSLLDIILENTFGYSFKKIDYIHNNQFLSLFKEQIDPRAADAVYIYFRNHFWHFFSSSQHEIRVYVGVHVVPRIQIAATLLAAVARGYLISESTCGVMESAFEGVISRHALSFCYVYECFYILLAIMLTNEFAAIYVEAGASGAIDLRTARHATLCSELLREILLINWMMFGSSEITLEEVEGDVSRMFSQRKGEYCAYQTLSNDTDMEIAKGFAQESIQYLWVYADKNEICAQRLIAILLESDILASHVAEETENEAFLAVYNKHRNKRKTYCNLQE